MKKERTPFYKRLRYIILLFIFLPPIGIPLLFKYSKKPSRNIKIALSVAWSIAWIAIIVGAQLSGQRTYTINNKSIKITCSSYCSYIDEYGDKDALKLLAGIGITNVKTAPVSLKDSKAELTVESSSADSSRLTIEYSDNKVTRIFNTDYSEVVYYSTNPADEVYNYPGTEQISAIKETRQKEEDAKKAAEKAAAEQQAKEEAARQAAEAAVPSAGDTAALCEEGFHKQYPYSGSKVHSITGLVTNSPYGSDTRLYKVGVTIENGFGAKYDAVMECVTKKSGNQISIDSFNVYR